MKKFRGKRRYYRNLVVNASNEKLDLSLDHWYDMWHRHVDWYGIGNESKQARHAHLKALFTLFRNFLMQLESCRRPYQTWVLVYQHDSAQDAVYFHTPNENSDNFPMKFEGVITDTVVPKLLGEFIDQRKFLMGHFTFEDDTIYIIYSPDHGLPPLDV